MAIMDGLFGWALHTSTFTMLGVRAEVCTVIMYSMITMRVWHADAVSSRKHEQQVALFTHRHLAWARGIPLFWIKFILRQKFDVGKLDTAPLSPQTVTTYSPKIWAAPSFRTLQNVPKACFIVQNHL